MLNQEQNRGGELNATRKECEERQTKAIYSTGRESVKDNALPSVEHELPGQRNAAMRIAVRQILLDAFLCIICAENKSCG